MIVRSVNFLAIGNLTMANNVKDMTGAGRSIDDIMAQVESLQNPDRASHSGGGGGSGMEYRIRCLEEDMSELKSDMKIVRSDLAELKGKVSLLPGYPGIASIMALVGGALLIVSRLFPAGTP